MNDFLHGFAEWKEQRKAFSSGLRYGLFFGALLGGLAVVVVFAIIPKPDYTMSPEQYQDFLSKLPVLGDNPYQQPSRQVAPSATNPVNSRSKPIPEPHAVGVTAPYLNGNELLLCQKWQQAKGYVVNGHCYSKDYLK